MSEAVVARFDHIVVAANPEWLGETEAALQGLIGPTLSVVP